MNIMEIDIDATSKEDYTGIQELMGANAPCVAFIQVKMHSDSFKDGHVIQHFVGVATEDQYYTVSCGSYLHELALKAMYEGPDPTVEHTLNDS